ncbi:hypothetical protein [Agreia sp. COWG]|uniref:hypothetical protein n=1 Tax=Agreia sp. COWG TaxID=2773266 RepID=UPI001925D330|nr:hypothetical protein [Agreia sp. COWG]
MNAAELHSEISDARTPGAWSCGSTTEWLEHACGRMRGHRGDHAELHDDIHHTVTIWSQSPPSDG